MKEKNKERQSDVSIFPNQALKRLPLVKRDQTVVCTHRKEPRERVHAHLSHI